MRRILVAALAAVLCLVAVPAAALAAQATLSGEVTYRERIALPDGATLRVRLIDLTAPGMPTRVEAEAAIASPGQVPLSFTLNFDDRVIAAAHRHAVVAEISAGGQLWFRNAAPEVVDPLAPAGPLLVVVNFVGRPATAPVAEPPAEQQPGESPSILDATWRAAAINGNATAAAVDSTLSIAGDMRAGGRGGCNSYFAQAELGAETLRFSAIAATRMACASTVVTVQEEDFFAALSAARFWRMTGEDLVLLDSGGKEVVRFTRSLR